MSSTPFRSIAARVLLALAACAGSFAPVWAQTDRPAGQVTFVMGVATAQVGEATRALRLGDQVAEGERLSTGPGGHVHIKTTDGGLLALRPDTTARIEIYEFNPGQPAATRIRLVLEAGVMRAASGAGAQAARDKFRLNTPVAAIGIRGTDFTVSATSSLTRLVVREGAVVMSPFGADCRPEALGPCGGDLARVLSADQAGKLLEVRRGQREPQLLELRPGAIPLSATSAPQQTAAAAGSGASAGTPPVSGSGTAAPVPDAPAGTTAAPPTPSRALINPEPAPLAATATVSTNPTAPSVAAPAPNVAGTASGSTPAKPPAPSAGTSQEVVAVAAAPLPAERLPGPSQAPLPNQVGALASEARTSGSLLAVAAAAFGMATNTGESTQGGSSTSQSPAAPSAPAPSTPSTTNPVATTPAPTPPVAVAQPTPVVQPTPLPVVTWGRWAPFANSAPVADTNAFRAQYGSFAATNMAYVLSVSDPQNLRMPETGQFNFKLSASEAFEMNGSTLVGPATVNSGELGVNFGARTFTTSLNVSASGVNAVLNSAGIITRDGRLEGFLIYSRPGLNMNVGGALGGSGANQAGYLFDGPLGNGRSVVGATSWRR
jgi:hypothetical protein